MFSETQTQKYAENGDERSTQAIFLIQTIIGNPKLFVDKRRKRNTVRRKNLLARTGIKEKWEFIMPAFLFFNLII